MSVADDAPPPLLDDGDVYDVEMDDIPPPSAEDIYGGDIVDPADAPEDPDLTDELPGVELTADHLGYLLDSGFTEDYLDLDHVAPLIRSFTEWDHVPAARRFAVDRDHPPTGIWFGHRDPKTGTVAWQLRPDHPTVGEDGRPKKYTFRRGSGSPVGIVSAPLTVPPVNHTVLVIEGTKQARVTAATLAHDPSYVIVCMPGCQQGVTNGRLQEGIAHVVKGAKQVVIVPDADAATNQYVFDAMDKLGKAIRSRMNGRRNCVKFGQLTGTNGQTDGIDDVLAGLPALERPAYLTDLIDNAITSPADVRPKQRPSRGDADADKSKFFHPFAGGLRTEACAEAILDSAHHAIDAESGVVHRFCALTGLYHPDRNSGSQRGSAYISDGLSKLLGDDYRTSFVSSVEDVVRRRLWDDERVIPEVPYTDGLLPVANGMLDLATRRLVPHSPDNFITAKLAVAYDPTADAAEFKTWLAAATRLDGETDQVGIILDTLSLVLDAAAGTRVPDRALYLCGPPRAGKGTLVNDVIAALVPGSAQTSMSLSEMAANKPFQNAKLYHKLLNISGETQDEFLSDMSLFKSAMGGDLISAEVKFGRAYSFRNRALHVFTANDMPHIRDTSGAVLARLTTVLFTQSNVGTEDRGIGKRLRAELPGVLNLLLEAWKARQERDGRYLEPAQQAVDQFISETNPIAEFVAERVVMPPPEAWVGSNTISPEWATGKTELYTSYKAHCMMTGRTPLSRPNFCKAITRPPFNIHATRTPNADNNRHVLGCRLRREDADSGIAMSMGDGTVDVAVGAAQMAQAHAKAVTDRVIGDWTHLHRDKDDDPDEDTGDHGGNNGGTTPPEPTPPTPTTAPSSDGAPPHPALARMGTEFWATMQRVGRVLPRPVITADTPLVRQRYEEAKYANECRSLTAGVTLTDLATTLNLPPEQARGYLRFTHDALKACGVTLLERRLARDNDLSAVIGFKGQFIHPTEKAKADTLSRAAKKSVTAAAAAVKATTASDGERLALELRAAEEAAAAAEWQASELKKLSEYLPLERLAYAVLIDPNRFAPKGA